MLINIHMCDVCCQATLLNWTILGTDNELLTLFLLFHEVVPPKLEPGKLLAYSIQEIYVGKSKDALDIVGDHPLGVKEVASMFGHFIKYRVKAEELQVQAQQIVRTNAFELLMRAQRQLQSVYHPPEISA